MLQGNVSAGSHLFQAVAISQWSSPGVEHLLYFSHASASGCSTQKPAPVSSDPITARFLTSAPSILKQSKVHMPTSMIFVKAMKTITLKEKSETVLRYAVHIFNLIQAVCSININNKNTMGGGETKRKKEEFQLHISITKKICFLKFSCCAKMESFFLSLFLSNRMPGDLLFKAVVYL